MSDLASLEFRPRFPIFSKNYVYIILYVFVRLIFISFFTIAIANCSNFNNCSNNKIMYLIIVECAISIFTNVQKKNTIRLLLILNSMCLSANMLLIIISIVYSTIIKNNYVRSLLFLYIIVSMINMIVVLYVHFISNLTKAKIIVKNIKNTSEPTCDSCIICLDLLQKNNTTEYIIMDCKHKYHQKCLSEWFKIHLTCPICRADVILE